jgi:hypothetical protein
MAMISEDIENVVFHHACLSSLATLRESKSVDSAWLLGYFKPKGSIPVVLSCVRSILDKNDSQAWRRDLEFVKRLVPVGLSILSICFQFEESKSSSDLNAELSHRNFPRDDLLLLNPNFFVTAYYSRTSVEFFDIGVRVIACY